MTRSSAASRSSSARARRCAPSWNCGAWAYGRRPFPSACPPDAGAGLRRAELLQRPHGGNQRLHRAEPRAGYGGAGRGPRRMTRLFASGYLDEDVDTLVAVHLRTRGFDGETSLEAGNVGYTDAEQLSDA